MRHELKTWPEFFEAARRGDKRFEVRKTDRCFQVGDTLMLTEWLPTERMYTGRVVEARVLYVLVGLEGAPMGIAPGFVVMSIERTDDA